MGTRKKNHELERPRRKAAAVKRSEAKLKRSKKAMTSGQKLHALMHERKDTLSVK